MDKIFNYIRSSTTCQSVLIWTSIYLIGFIQNLWIGWDWALKMGTMNFAALLIVYYTTYKVLIPKLLIKGKKIWYFICSVLLVAIFSNACSHMELYLFDRLDIDIDIEFRQFFSISRYATFFILTYAISSIIFFYKRTTEDARQKAKLLSEKKMLEARVLKSQINSHFIFNALNNIYSMIYFKDEYTCDYVLKLAQMMRYVMEDCETELTPLSKEIEYIENFIDFQKLRFENDKNITFTYKVDDSAHISVPPMLLQPLVENCFKHTPLEVDKNSYVHILLEIKEKKIHFISENSQPLIKNKPDPGKVGIGIENVKKRLELYYENSYQLEISDNLDSFKVELSINL